MFLGTQVKQGVASTLERVFQASGQKIERLEVFWSGKTAGIVFKRTTANNLHSAKIFFPSIDDMATISRRVFNNTVGYALHELGHAWFTDNEPWDDAREKHGSYVGSLINGLEDPRIEQCVINSGYAPNSKALFEELTNSVLDKSGYVQPDDLKNVPFMLAIEGRRMNGYPITHPTVIGKSPYSADIKWALDLAKQAKTTQTITAIAIELFKRLQQAHEDQKKQPPPPPPEPKEPQGDKGDSKDGDQQQGDDQSQGDGQQGDQGGDQGGDQDSGQQGDQGDGEGQGSGNGEQSADGGSGKPEQGDEQGKPSDGEPSEQGGNGKSSDPFTEKRRRPEFDKFIQNELGKHRSDTDNQRQRPAVARPKIASIDFC